MKNSLVVLLLMVVGCFSVEQDQEKQKRQEREKRRANTPNLEVGEMAPTFVLKSLDGESETDLASFRGEKPVVLFFGSYT